MESVQLGDVVDDPPFAVAMFLATRLGWRVLPLSGKRPVVDTWQRDATTNPRVIEEWWSWYTYAEVGVAMGPESGIWVLDVDVKNGVDGTESLAALAAGRELPETFTVRSRSGRGLHLYWAWPELDDDRVIKNSAGRLGPGLDVKGVRGQVRAPHKAADVLDPRRPVPAPGWLLDAVIDASARSRGGDVVRPAYWVDARSAVVDAAASLAIIETGSRNDALNRYAFKLGALAKEVGIDRESAHDALMFACRQNGLWEEEPEQCGVTFASGWNAGVGKTPVSG